MISQLTGKIININDKSLIIDVNGIGYQVFCSSQTIFQFKNIDDTVTILTELIVREDSLTLFGFSDLNEKEWFNLLVSVQGVGAKAALAIFSSLSIDELGYAISNAEKLTITKADGVGPKIAGRIINELKDKVPNNQNDPLFKNFISSANKSNKKIIEDAVSALTNLGYNKTNCGKIVLSIFEENHQDLPLPELISKSLKKLGNKYE